MKPCSARISIIATLLFSVAIQAHAATERPITILQPSGGEVYAPGSSQTILLDPKTRAKTILIEISRDGGVNFDTVGIIDNTQKAKALRNKFTWVPDLPASNEAILRATSTDPRKPGEGLSNLFTIADVLDSDPSGLFVLKAGDTMTGALTLPGAPSQDLHAATKKYVDDAVAAVGGLENGGTINGDLTVDGNLTVTGTITIPATTRYYSLNHSAFLANIDANSTAATNVTLTDTKSSASVGISGVPPILYAPVNLPHGATISEFQMTVENDVGKDITVVLAKNSLSSGSMTIIQTLISPSNSGTTPVTGTALTEVVDNSANSYVVKASVGAGATLKMISARIKYTVTAPVP